MRWVGWRRRNRRRTKPEVLVHVQLTLGCSRIVDNRWNNKIRYVKPGNVPVEQRGHHMKHVVLYIKRDGKSGQASLPRKKLDPRLLGHKKKKKSSRSVGGGAVRKHPQSSWFQHFVEIRF